MQIANAASGSSSASEGVLAGGRPCRSARELNVLMFNTREGSLRAWGGDSAQVVQTAAKLLRMGVRVDVAESASMDLARYDLVHIFNIQTAENGLSLLRRAKALKKPVAVSPIYWDLATAEMHPDCLRFGSRAGFRMLASRAPRLASALYRARYVHCRFRLRSAQQELLSEADVVLPNSIAEMEIIVGQFKKPSLRAKSVVVHNAVLAPSLDDSAYEAWEELPNRFVLMAAAFHPVKGQARLLRALMDWPEPVVCVGRNLDDSAYGQYCRSLAAARPNTFLLGAVRPEQMGALYSRARVHALPSLRESPGLASLEAATYGANCVVGIHAPVWEYFESDAFVCDPQDPRSLRRAVIEAWDAPPPDALRRRVLTHFTWEKAAQQTWRGYELALGRPS